MTAPRIPAAHLQAIMDALEAIGAHKAEVKGAGIRLWANRLAVVAVLEDGLMAQPHVLLIGLLTLRDSLPITVGHKVYMELRQMRDQAAETPRHAFSL